MRVLHIQKSKGIGGSERHLVDLLAGQAERGIEVRMCVMAAGDAHRFETALTDRGIDTKLVPAGATFSASALARLTRVVREFRPDLVHTHLIHADVHGQAVAKAVGVPAVSTIHGPKAFYRRHPTRAAAQLAARLARRTIVISEYLRSYVVEWGVVPQERVRVVPYGLDPTRWAPSPQARAAARAELGLGPDDVAVGIASRLIEGKGHEVLIDAVAHARRTAPSVVLLVAGDGDRRAALEALAAGRAPGGVRFLGYAADVAPFIHACDVIAVPTQPELGEGFGLVALEAMACGRPVVVTDTASLPEVVTHGECGLVVPARDVDALTGALVTLTDADLRTSMGEAGRARATSRYSLDAMVSRTLHVYEETLGVASASSSPTVG